MRLSENCHQTRLDRPCIQDLPLNPKSRDDTERILRGLQVLWSDTIARERVLSLVAKDVHETAARDKGRKGMDHWSIFVLATVRLGLNVDYDRLQNLAEQHRQLRMAMGIGSWEEGADRFDWRRIRGNIDLLKPETLVAINEVITTLGSAMAPGSTDHLRADSFVMGTNVHFPSDIRQLTDAIRCLVRHAHRLAQAGHSTLMRQHRHLEKRLKSLALIAGKASASRGKERESRLQDAVAHLCNYATERSEQAQQLLDELDHPKKPTPHMEVIRVKAESARVRHFLACLSQCSDVAYRHLVCGEKVPVGDKLFSVWETDTELIVRGKVPMPVEFGHRVVVVEDAAGFIVHAAVQPNGEQDRDVAVPLTRSLKERYPELKSLSLDRGYHSPENQEAMAAIIPLPVLPTTGIHASVEQSERVSEEWHRMRRRHPGIESAIGALQFGNGCARCRDRTRRGYERYLQFAVLGRNVSVLGRLHMAMDHEGSLAAYTRRSAVA